jgi:hypothetical protein
MKLDETIPKYATNLAYLSRAKKNDEIESKIIYSIIKKQPKRADHYFILTITNQEDPYTFKYTVDEVLPGTIYKINFMLGFKIDRRINDYFDMVLRDMMADGTIPYESLDDFIYQGEPDGPPPPGVGAIKFSPTSVTAGNTAVATLYLPNTVNTTSVYTITTDGNSTSSVSSVTVPANSLTATFNVTVNSTVASTVTGTTVTATLGSASYTGTLVVGNGGGVITTTRGIIYQVKAEMNPAVAPITYVPSVTDDIYSPKRIV